MPKYSLRLEQGKASPRPSPRAKEHKNNLRANVQQGAKATPDTQKILSPTSSARSEHHSQPEKSDENLVKNSFQHTNKLSPKKPNSEPQGSTSNKNTLKSTKVYIMPETSGHILLKPQPGDSS